MAVAHLAGDRHRAGVSMGGPIHLAVRFYLYGQEARSAAPAVEARWQQWLAQRFPAEGRGQPV